MCSAFVSQPSIVLNLLTHRQRHQHSASEKIFGSCTSLFASDQRYKYQWSGFNQNGRNEVTQVPEARNRKRTEGSRSYHSLLPALPLCRWPIVIHTLHLVGSYHSLLPLALLCLITITCPHYQCSTDTFFGLTSYQPVYFYQRPPVPFTFIVPLPVITSTPSLSDTTVLLPSSTDKYTYWQSLQLSD